MIKILFMGRKNISADVLEWLSELTNIKVVGVLTDHHLKNSPTSAAAEHMGYPIYSFEDAQFKISNGTLDFDLGISILYWRKLTNEFLTTPSKGIINFHPAPLPDYKGTGGYNFAILDGLEDWGVSAHYVDEAIDTGPIIEVVRFAIDARRETCLSLEKKSKKELHKLAIRTLTRLLINEEQLPRLPNVGGRYITRQEMEAEKEIHPDDDIEKKIRAFWFPPYDGAYIKIEGKHFTLVSVEILKSFVNINYKYNDSINMKYSPYLAQNYINKINPGDNVEEKVRLFWHPPSEGAYIEIQGRHYTLVDREILASLAPPGTTSLFTTKFDLFSES